jgi:hypothetical protein
MTFHAEIMQPGDAVYVSNKRGDRVRIFYADDNGAMIEVSPAPVLPDPPHDPAATVVLNASNIHQYRRR